ncbi:ABC transporter permease [Planomonospora sp. ID67723]|uniref:ABC transporter permease n=1 Tax=Planomonospora sp. ID67723 TaxID=2738134 RepID=UPI0018C3546E|nr:ABC transporter permease [Planomonospora sp. ID67723]MBG0827787.1 ABC transporter permease [Planomonospora sp. ID67723]
MTSLTSPPARVRESGAFAELAKANARELVRDPKNFFFVLVFPLIFMALFLFMGTLNPADGAGDFDPMRAGIPAVLLMAFMSLAFFGTATPLISLRQKGTLRMLGTTPLNRTVFILAQAPVRFAIALGQLAALSTVALATGFLEPSAIGRLLISCVLGLAMLFALGYMVAARMRNPELANGVLALVMPVLLMFSGVFLPMEIFPETVRAVAERLPTSYFADALRQDLVGVPGGSIVTAWLVMAGVAIVAATVAVTLFSWTDGEKR